MSNQKIEDLLKLAADMQTFYPHRDALTAYVESCSEDEISLNELDLVAAAAAAPNYKAFWEAHLREQNPTGKK